MAQEPRRRSGRLAAQAQARNEAGSQGIEKMSPVVAQTSAKIEQVKSIFNEVCRSVVRISFIWDPDKKGYEHMVICGVIFRIDNDGSALIVADPTFFVGEKYEFVESFPTEKGYGKDIPGSYGDVIVKQDFCILTVKPTESEYIKSAKFEIGPLGKSDCIHTFVFPREGYKAPPAYCQGSFVNISQQAQGNLCLAFHDCSLHEYAYLGSPVFNERGHFIAMTYANQSRLHAWTVWRLHEMVLQDYNDSIGYVLNGVHCPSPSPAAPVSEVSGHVQE